MLFLLLFCAVVFIGCRYEESDRHEETADRGWLDADTAAEKYGLMIYETPFAEALSGETGGADADALDHRAVSVGNSVFFLHNGSRLYEMRADGTTFRLILEDRQADRKTGPGRLSQLCADGTRLYFRLLDKGIFCMDLNSGRLVDLSGRIPSDCERYCAVQGLVYYSDGQAVYRMDADEQRENAGPVLCAGVTGSGHIEGFSVRDGAVCYLTDDGQKQALWMSINEGEPVRLHDLNEDETGTELQLDREYVYLNTGGIIRISLETGERTEAISGNDNPVESFSVREGVLYYIQPDAGGVRRRAWTVSAGGTAVRTAAGYEELDKWDVRRSSFWTVTGEYAYLQYGIWDESGQENREEILRISRYFDAQQRYPLWRFDAEVAGAEGAEAEGAEADLCWTEAAKKTAALTAAAEGYRLNTGLSPVLLLELAAQVPEYAAPGGFTAVSQGGWIYYAADGCGIFRMRADGTDNELMLCEGDGIDVDDMNEYDCIGNLQVWGEWLYFTASGQCFRLRLDAAELQTVDAGLQGGRGAYCIFGDKIYSGYEGITAIDPNDGHRQVLVSGKKGRVYPFAVDNRGIFYIRENEENGCGQLIKTDPDGAHERVLASVYENRDPVCIGDIRLDDGWIYILLWYGTDHDGVEYQDGGEILAVKTDGSERRVCVKAEESSCILSMDARGGVLYTCTGGRGAGLYCLTQEDSEPRLLYEFRAGQKTGCFWKAAGSYLLSQAGRDYDYEGSGVGEAVRISLDENIKAAGRLEYFDWNYWENTGFGQWETDISDGN